MKKIGVFLVSLFFVASVFGQNDSDDAFIVQYNITSSDYEVQIELLDLGTIDFQIDWGDGSPVETVTTAKLFTDPLTHTYTNAGTYNVEITGSWGQIVFGKRGSTWSSDSKNQITDIIQWGTNVPVSREWQFSDCDGLTTITATDSPKMPSGGSLRNMFAFSENFKGNTLMANWNTEGAQKMKAMFKQCNISFSIAEWNLSSIVTGTNGMADFLDGGSMTQANYDAFLDAMRNETHHTPTPTDIIFHAGNSYHCDVDNNRAILTSTPYNWDITDDGQDCTGTARVEGLGLNTIELYPNPIQNNLYLEGLSSGLPIVIYDVLGAQVFYTQTSEEPIDLSNLKRGVYFLQITINNSTLTHKIVKN